MTEYIVVSEEFIGGPQDDEDDPSNYEYKRLPAKYTVCGTCQGRGKTSNYLGAFTAETMDEAGSEFMEDYFAGNFDRPCEECNGLRVVLVPDHDHPEFDEKIFQEWQEIEYENWRDERLHRMEMSMYGDL